MCYQLAQFACSFAERQNRRLQTASLDCKTNMSQQTSLAGKKILVTAGGTREAIDAVRFIGNRSSGKQGYAIAEEALQRGAEVTLVATVVRDLSEGIARYLVVSAAEMRDAVVPRASEADAVIMAAAVADFRPSSAKRTKHKKSEGVPAITLEPTADILVELGQNKPASQVLVGFAAESDNIDANACSKLAEKGADMIVANSIVASDAGFDSDTNEVVIFSWADGYQNDPAAELVAEKSANDKIKPRKKVNQLDLDACKSASRAIQQLHVPSASKRKIASVLLDLVEHRLAALR